MSGFLSCMLVTTLISQVGFGNPVEAARRIVLAVYSELAASHQLVDLSIGPYSLDVQWPNISRLSLRVYQDGAGRRGANTTRIASEISLDEHGALLELRSVGPLVNTDRLGRMVADVDLHRSWSDKHVMAALRTAGSHFAPDQMTDPERIFEERIRLLEPVLGNLRVDSVHFSTRVLDDFEKGFPSAEVTWRITVSVKDPGEGPTTYEITCEPFDGQIVKIYGYRE